MSVHSQHNEYPCTNGKLTKVPSSKAPYVVSNDRPPKLRGGSKSLGTEVLDMFGVSEGDMGDSGKAAATPGGCVGPRGFMAFDVLAGGIV